MTQKHRIRISDDLKNFRPKCKYKRPYPEGYGFQNGDFCFSDDLDDWKYGPTRRGAKYPDLF